MKIVIATCGIVGLAEWIIDNTCIVVVIFQVIGDFGSWYHVNQGFGPLVIELSKTYGPEWKGWGRICSLVGNADTNSSWKVKDVFWEIVLIQEVDLRSQHSNPIVHPYFSLSVPTIQNLSKQNNFQVRIVIATGGGTVCPAEGIIDDTCLYLVIVLPHSLNWICPDVLKAPLYEDLFRG